MKRIALAFGLALAGTMPALAQDATQDPTVPATPATPATPANPEAPMTPATPAVPATPATPADPSIPTMPEQAAGSVHTPTQYHGPHRYPAKTRGRAGDPPVIDHSMDTLVVEPTKTTITIPAPTTTP
jgi:hypothetical protein